MGNNLIGDQGVRALGAALCRNRSLCRLSLDYNWVGAGLFFGGGPQALGNALTVNQHIFCLDLRANSIGDGGARVLARGLPKNRSLVQLNLRGNLIGNAGASSFAAALDQNRTLEILDLNDNFIDRAGARTLQEAAERNGQTKVQCTVPEITYAHHVPREPPWSPGGFLPAHAHEIQLLRFISYDDALLLHYYPFRIL
jgi:hypothetical protein